MKKIPFDLDKWLSDKSQKVVTCNGIPVRIICTDAKALMRTDDVIVLISGELGAENIFRYYSNGTLISKAHPKIADKYDLFIVTDDSEQLESEDKRIRKELIDMVNLNYADEEREMLVSWLEKQKEQSVTANDLDEEIHRFFDDCVDVHEAKLYGNISERVIPVDCYEITARHFAKWGEKQKEQEPIELSDDFEVALEEFLMNTDSSSNTYKEDVKKYANRLHEIVRKEQESVKKVESLAEYFNNEFEKQVANLLASAINREYKYTKEFVSWATQALLGYAKNELKSVEDERMLNVAIRSCEQTIIDYPNDKVRFNDCIAWLKSLPLNLKKKNENVAKLCSNKWSEEDEKIYQFVLKFFTNCWWKKEWEVSREQVLELLKSPHKGYSFK